MGDIPRRGKAAAQAQCQRAVIDGGTAGIGVGSGQRQRGGTVLDQAAVHCIGQRHRSAGIQRNVAADVQRSRAERAVGADRQATCIQRKATAEEIAVVQREHAGSGLDQAAGARDQAAQGSVLVADQAQLRAGIEIDCIGQVQGHRAVESSGHRH
ncbi:hypothetical protein G6F63_014453 [Rhizopus arrhizus]|nr:hypothetical protein G6F63_014453 [Rhizopus arrhizus]